MEKYHLRERVKPMHSVIGMREDIKEPAKYKKFKQVMQEFQFSCSVKLPCSWPAAFANNFISQPIYVL